MIARKFRPQSFHELKGQEAVRKTLSNAFKNDKLHHALLLAGPRGTGKTSTARIIAKVLRCSDLKEGVPCGVCQNCTEIAESRSLDVLEIDGASNNGVDSIRELRDTVGFHATSGSKKVYIIDEVHMLSTSAFNALLKTLEEPPANVYFIMATTEIHKVPKTILSRCQRFDFKPVPHNEVVELLKSACEQEDVSYEMEGLHLLARVGEGCVRDSYSFLDQVLAFSDNNVKAAEVTDLLGLTDVNFYKELIGTLLKRDAQKLTEQINMIRESSFEPQIILEDLVRHLKNISFVKLSGGNPSKFTEAENKIYAHLASESQMEDLLILFDICYKGVADLLRTFDPSLLLEITLIKACSAPTYSELGTAVVASPPQQATQTNTNSAPAKNFKPQRAAPVQRTQNPVGSSSPTPSSSSTSSGGDSKMDWGQFVTKIKSLNPVVGSKLEVCNYSFDDSSKTIYIAESESASFMKEQLQSQEFLNTLKNYIRAFLGPQISVDYNNNPERELKSSNQDQKKQKVKEKHQAVRKEVENHDLIKDLQSKYKTKIVDIKEMS